ncbi:hypothetical protein Q7P37_010886 [Cladosporium fusiforme]
MPPPFDIYQQQQQQQGGFDHHYAAYGQSQQMSHQPINRQHQQPMPQPQDAFPMQQQPAMVAPSVSGFQQQQHHQAQLQQAQWQQQANYNNYQQHFAQIPPSQHQTYHNPAQQTPPQYHQPSPLQQFASGQLQQDTARQQQYWHPPPPQTQATNYVNAYPQPQSQPQPVQTHGQPYIQGQQFSRQSLGSSPVVDSHPNIGPTVAASVNRHPSQQQSHDPSQSQHAQSTPGPQRQQSFSGRPLQITPTANQPANQHIPQQHQQQQQYQRHTPSQPSVQQHSQSLQSSNAASQQASRQPSQTPRRTSQPLQAPSSTPNSRTLTHVQIPAYRPEDMAHTPQSHVPKRRHSNDGKPIQVRQPQKPQQPAPPSQGAYVQIPKPPESSPLTEFTSSQFIPPTPTPDIDYQSVLLSLSEEYVTAAHSMSLNLCSSDATEDDLAQYHQLIATALGCLESVITNYRAHDARKEARTRLRFASLLFEETENTMIAEESLSKGISFCERNRLMDSKYAMQHLLVRVMLKTNPTAAIRTLEKLIQEVEAMGITHWIYAFRILRVTLGMQSGRPSDTSNVLRHLVALKDRADAKQHTAVKIIAAILDAFVHLQSGDAMAVELASRSLASARTYQLAPVMNEVPQLHATMDLLDIACAFMQSTPLDQIVQKMGRFHDSLDGKMRSSGWTMDGSFLLPLGGASKGDVEADTGGVFRKTPAGETALSFMWLSRSQLYMIGYMLGGLSRLGTNAEDRRAEKTLAEGLRLNRPFNDPTSSDMSIKTVQSIGDIQQRIAFSARLLQIFAYCGRADWTTAWKAIEFLRGELSKHPQYTDKYTSCSLLYLSGACKQGMGEDRAALEIYQSPELSIKSNPQKGVTPIKDLQVLAGLNSISILRSLSPDPKVAEQALADLGPYCETSPNKSIVSAYHVLRAHDPDPSMTIIRIKQCLQGALQPAQAIKNFRILAIIMNTMTAQFFDGIVGKQAVNSASAGRQLARRSQDPLWMTVGAGMYREAVKRNGDLANTAQAEQEVRAYMEKVPQGVKARLSS